MDSADAADLNLSVLPPVEPSTEQRCLLDSLMSDHVVFNRSQKSNSMVFNLFIEGEEPEAVEDEETGEQQAEAPGRTD